jgi:hypothetical protein
VSLPPNQISAEALKKICDDLSAELLMSRMMLAEANVRIAQQTERLLKQEKRIAELEMACIDPLSPTRPQKLEAVAPTTNGTRRGS